MDPTGKKHNNNLNVLQNVTLEQLDALDILEDSPLHIVSSCVPTTEDRVTWVVNMLQDDFTPLLTHHHSAITNIASVIDSPSGGVSINQVVTDDYLNGSTNTSSTTDSLTHYVINKLYINWKDRDFWKAKQGK